MSLPTVDEGLGFITYDDVSTNSALLSKQQSDLSGNVTQRQFCIDAFHLAGNRDVSNALIVSDDITTETDNVLAFIGSNVKSVQRTYLSNINISTKNQLFAINAYGETLYIYMHQFETVQTFICIGLGLGSSRAQVAAQTTPAAGGFAQPRGTGAVNEGDGRGCGGRRHIYM